MTKKNSSSARYSSAPKAQPTRAVARALTSPSVVIPALLTFNPDRFERELTFAAAEIGAIHLDVIDGSFCPGRAIAIDRWPLLNIRYSEAHLMVQKPLPILETLAAKKVTRAIVHIESVFDPAELHRRARELDLLLGWAVNPDTDLDCLRPLYAMSTYVQVMGVHPGASGQRMIPATALAAAYLKRLPAHRLTVSVDGGVNEETIGQLMKTGVNYVVADQAIFGSDGWSDNTRRLRAASRQLQ